MTRVALVVERTHPAFEGHFPSRPILPGVVLLDLTVATIAAHFALRQTEPPFTTRISAAKFLSPIAPGEAVALDFDDAGPRYVVRVYAGHESTERLAMSGTFVFEPRASD